jgi:secreted PhoX family phosphatase
LHRRSQTFDPTKQTAAAQARHFGYNNDYVGYIPLMFPGLVTITDGKRAFA